jgi:hypothetical protein
MKNRTAAQDSSSHLNSLARTKPFPNSQIGYGIAAQHSHPISSMAAISFQNIVYLAFIRE